MYNQQYEFDVFIVSIPLLRGNNPNNSYTRCCHLADGEIYQVFLDPFKNHIVSALSLMT